MEVYQKLKNLFKRENENDHSQFNFTPDFEIRSKLLNLGCGASFHSSWDNFDLVPSHPSVRQINLLKPLPFQDSSYVACYCSHVLEHLSRSYAPQFLKEMVRVLKPGGTVRLVVPDLEEIARRYLQAIDDVTSGNENARSEHEWMSLELLDQLARTTSGGYIGRLWRSRPLEMRDFILKRLGNEALKWIDKADSDPELMITHQQIYETPELTPESEISFRNTGEIHRWMYDRVSLGKLMREAGLSNILVCDACSSNIPDFSSYCLDVDSLGKTKKPDSLFIEGTVQ